MKRHFTTITLLALSFISIVCAQSGTVETITPEETSSLIGDTSVVILDVRTHDEYASETGHMKDALLIPVQELGSRMNELEQYRGKKIIAVCRSGNRSGRATKLLREKGFNAYNMTGGMNEWNSLKLPIVKETRE